MQLQHSDFPQAVNSAYRAPPHNIEVEQALLGAILLDNESLDRVSDFLGADHFFDPLHAEIYSTAASLIQGGRTVSPITLRTYFEGAAPITGDLTVPQYLAKLAAGAVTISGARDYGQTIVELATRRQMISLGEDITNQAYAGPVNLSPRKLLDEIMSRTDELGRWLPSERKEKSRDQIIDEVLAEGRQAMERGSGLVGLSTGLRDLDMKLGGLAPSDMIVLAGRPGMGKSALSMGIAHWVAKSGIPAAIFSMEMGERQVYARLIAERAGISAERWRRGRVDANRWPEIEEAADGLRPLPLYVDQTGGLTIGQLATRARQLHRRHKLGLIVVDYIQLMSGSGNKFNNRTNDITEITTGIKTLAKELDVPIIALSQLNRSVESRDDKRPMLADLRESGSIEQDADLVMMIYREDYYLEREEPPSTEYSRYADWLARMQAASGLAEIIIGKARHGPTGTVKVSFQKDVTKFSDLVREGRAND